MVAGFRYQPGRAGVMYGLSTTNRRVPWPLMRPSARPRNFARDQAAIEGGVVRDGEGNIIAFVDDLRQEHRQGFPRFALP